MVPGTNCPFIISSANFIIVFASDVDMSPLSFVWDVEMAIVEGQVVSSGFKDPKTSEILTERGNFNKTNSGLMTDIDLQLGKKMVPIWYGATQIPLRHRSE